MTEFFRRQTNKENFKTRDIIKWIDGEYKVSGKITIETYNNILVLLEKEYRNEFTSFAKENVLVDYE